MAWLCGLALIGALLPGCPGEARPTVLNGYVEGDYVLVAPREAGRVASVEVREGTSVREGEVLFRLDASGLAHEVKEAKSRLAQAEAQLADLEQGKRQEEIAVTQAELDRARAALADAEIGLVRQATLRREGVVAQSAMDAAQAAHDKAQADVAAVARRMRVENMPARLQEISAARGNVEAARATLAQAEWRLSELAVTAPAAGLVEDVLRRPGEMVGPDAAVVSLLPPRNRKVRFFVPEALRSRVAPGLRLPIACDGCAAGMSAVVRSISSQAEFTPPVIYSVESRQKLVFAVEAAPEGDALGLSPGQPVDVTLP
ncbi:MAG: HlyD family secretion protein [Parvibaculaceae bacterium]